MSTTFQLAAWYFGHRKHAEGLWPGPILSGTDSLRHAMELIAGELDGVIEEQRKEVEGFRADKMEQRRRSREEKENRHVQREAAADYHHILADGGVGGGGGAGSASGRAPKDRRRSHAGEMSSRQMRRYHLD